MSKEKHTPDAQPAAFVKLSEEERLRHDIYRPDMDKFRLFTAMLRRISC
jgi:hypothetical protein